MDNRTSDDYSEDRKGPRVSVVNSFEESKELKKGIHIIEKSLDDKSRVILRIRNQNQFREEDVSTLVDPVSEFMYEKVSTMTLEEGLQILADAVEYHDDDVNFPAQTMAKITGLLAGECRDQDPEGHDLDVKIEAALIKYHSPYPEVRAICDPFDDPTIPVETIRAYVLGTIWVCIGSFVNTFFNQRQPSLRIQSTVIQLLLYPCGKVVERLPNWSFTFRGNRYCTNPGPWTHKEQMLVTTMVNIAAGSSNFMGYVLTMTLDTFFGMKYLNFGFIFLMNFSTLFFGFGLAGLLRKWVIYPVKAVWPTILPTLALNRALLLPEAKSSVNGWTITRYKFFFVMLIASFFYFFFPNYIFKVLSTFNWMTWIAPQNKNLAIVTGSYLGLGYNPITTFDWAVINYSSPLVVPFFSLMNRYLGMFLSGILLIALYWTNYKWTGYLPINSNDVFDSMGEEYNISRVTMAGGNLIDLEGYRNYSPPYMSIGNLISSGASFSVYTLCFTYILLTERRIIWQALKGFWQQIRNPKQHNLATYEDPISRIMAKYPEVPDWWYAIVFVIALVFGIVGITMYPTDTPVWSILVIVALSVAMLVPTALIFAVTGYQLGMSNLAVIVTGYMVPGNAMANMICRVYGYNIDDQAEDFISDLKMGHYSKLPPRSVFRAQMLATLLQTLVTIGTTEFLIASVSDLCSVTQIDRFVCSFPRSLYADTIMFGLVGPERMFNSLYPALKYCFLIGFVAAVGCWLLRMYFPRYLKYVHPVLIISGVNRWGGSYNLSYYTPGLFAGFAFSWHIKRHYLAWWVKYNYLLTSGLSAGIAFSGIVIFLTLQYTKTKFNWWGNDIISSGVDFKRAAALYEVPEGGFGVKIGDFQ
ncbi:OPT oligopeptide transporter protein-domain-containing protein [Lipomyces tetrasporus]